MSKRDKDRVQIWGEVPGRCGSPAAVWSFGLGLGSFIVALLPGVLLTIPGSVGAILAVVLGIRALVASR